MIEGRLGYNAANGRYGLLDGEEWLHPGFCCGEPVEIYDDETKSWKRTRFEMDWSSGSGVWYLTGTSIFDTNIEYLRARIEE